MCLQPWKVSDTLSGASPTQEFSHRITQYPQTKLTSPAAGLLITYIFLKPLILYLILNATLHLIPLDRLAIKIAQRRAPESSPRTIQSTLKTPPNTSVSAPDGRISTPSRQHCNEYETDTTCQHQLYAPPLEQMPLQTKCPCINPFHFHPFHSHFNGYHIENYNPRISIGHPCVWGECACRDSPPNCCSLSKWSISKCQGYGRRS